ncbi:regulator of microtubule dynamics protein 1-like isoform X2 [Ruditapes philippinarum]|uniref:regulator of microtubule dynamics protein 1-like isoform X2 n=1 Tax=Ruditapes philippinarum TaxID=129788 RepID=UPI00295B69A3|nr:regulator of microtubule dynamics protein 1-like isoform X2 [Ruditapes philippinarum]
MSSSRLNYFLRLTQLRVGCVRSIRQQTKRVTNKMNGQRSCYRKLLVPLVTGNTMYALFGINWGGNEEKADVIKTDNTTVEDVRQQILNKADYLYSENKVVALYDFLRMHQHSEDDEILWRLARAAVDKGKLPEFTDMKRDLYYEAYDYIKKALELNPRNFAVHKWYAILLDYTGELEGNKQRLINAVQVKEHFQKAIELNPKDATSIHSLGQWCFTFAAMPWYQRKLAAVIYASPPSSTFEEALTYFLQAEETEPNFYSMNLLMLGKTYMRLKDAEMALTYLTRCINHPVKTPDDKQANDEAGCLFKMLTQKKPPSDK